MKFCEKCNTKLVKINLELKCQKCDDLSQITENKKNGTMDSSFPFEINQYYSQKNIRGTLSCHSIHGINFNKEKKFFTLLRNAHKLLPNQKNVYLDKYDSETGLYHYIGMGTTGDQTMIGLNLQLSNSKESNIKVHLFWQYNVGSDHQYMGIVQVENTQEIIQSDKNGKDRKVLNFILRSI
jgi:hypothetical protein